MLAPLLVITNISCARAKGDGVCGESEAYLPVCLASAGYLLMRIALLGKLAPVLQHAQITWPQAIFSGFALVTKYAQLLFGQRSCRRSMCFMPASRWTNETYF